MPRLCLFPPVTTSAPCKKITVMDISDIAKPVLCQYSFYVTDQVSNGCVSTGHWVHNEDKLAQFCPEN